MVYLFSDAVKCDEQGKFGWKCRFTCNCKDGEECEKETGYCENGCVEGYYGTGCQFSEYYNELLLSVCIEPTSRCWIDWHGENVQTKINDPLKDFHSLF